MQQPRVVVGIVTRDRASVVPRAIDSVLSQRYAALHVWIINDGSNDDTAKLAMRYPSVLWTNLPDSRGYMANRNHMMANADAEYFISLDDDAWFMGQDEVSVAVQYLEDNPAAGAVAFDVLSPDNAQPVARSSPRAVPMFIGCGHAIRLSVARQLGYYQTAPGMYGGEEKDFCLRMIDTGHRTILLPGVHVWHNKTAVARDIPSQHRSGVCNDLAMALRRTPAWLLPAAMLSKIYRHLMFSMTHGLIKPCVQGFVLFLRSIPEIWASRRPVKASSLRTYMNLRGK